MKIINFYRAKSGYVRKGNVLVTRGRTLMRVEAQRNLSAEKICDGCAITEDLCAEGGLLCGTRGYFIDIEPTEEIEHARSLFILKGELP